MPGRYPHGRFRAAAELGGAIVVVALGTLLAFGLAGLTCGVAARAYDFAAGEP